MIRTQSLCRCLMIEWRESPLKVRLPTVSRSRLESWALVTDHETTHFWEKFFSFNKTTFNPHFQRIQTINNISLFRTFSDGKVCWSQKIYLNRLRLRTRNSFTKLKSAAFCFHIWHLICIQQLKTAFQPSIFFIHREEGCIYSFSSCKSSMNLQVE